MENVFTLEMFYDFSAVVVKYNRDDMYKIDAIYSSFVL